MTLYNELRPITVHTGGCQIRTQEVLVRDSEQVIEVNYPDHPQDNTTYDKIVDRYVLGTVKGEASTQAAFEAKRAVEIKRFRAVKAGSIKQVQGERAVTEVIEDKLENLDKVALIALAESRNIRVAKSWTNAKIIEAIRNA